MVTILVAFDDNRVIGKDNQLPWKLPEDLQRFKKITMGHTVIMGRKTWDSLPKKPLPGRLNIVLSRGFVSISTEVSVTNDTSTYVTDELQDALAYARRERPSKEVFIIGGLQIYEMALESGVVDRINVTKVHGQHDGDVYFPDIGQAWSLVSFEKKERFDLLYYKRRKDEQ